MNSKLFRQSKSTQKIPQQVSQQKNLEQVYIKRLQEQEAFMPKDIYIQKHKSMHQIMNNQQSQPLRYYSHINEIRSIKEFIYISEKLKQKNIERKMQERLELKGKLNQIKQIEIGKKLQYYVERKIRLFIKDRQHEENPYNKSFEAFYEFYSNDPKLKTFEKEKLLSEFNRLSSQVLNVPVSRSQHAKITISPPPKNMYQINEDNEPTLNEEDDGTSKFLTMKAANRLLGLMMVESSKGKRTPIVWALNKKKELQELLNKPFGGKMNFTMNAFNWLIDNAIQKSQAYINKNQVVEQKSVDPKKIGELIDKGLVNIKRTLSKRPASSNNVRSCQQLKHRNDVALEYCISERVRQNVIQQKLRNQKLQEQQKIQKSYLSNDSYVNHYI
ncbi:unnamed protein product [Paramecium octaurelia]|uniref:Uncharacterized protein n=1 Tax=Paramecium octaurelia TaxID=43137 RepID=A0A8S1T367_PAROT|nr:unnamed protein product [Paramecium octaurelia]